MNDHSLDSFHNYHRNNSNNTPTRKIRSNLVETSSEVSFGTLHDTRNKVNSSDSSSEHFETCSENSSDNFDSFTASDQDQDSNINISGVAQTRLAEHPKYVNGLEFDKYRDYYTSDEESFVQFDKNKKSSLQELQR